MRKVITESDLIEIYEKSRTNGQILAGLYQLIGGETGLLTSISEHGTLARMIVNKGSGMYPRKLIDTTIQVAYPISLYNVLGADVVSTKKYFKSKGLSYEE